MASSKDINVKYVQFGRVGKVELLKNGSPMGINLDGLDFKFRTGKIFQQGDDATANSCTVSILGLTQESVDNLCVFCDQPTYKMMGITARVYAGYENQSSNIKSMEIFHLPVVGAVPSMPPDNWVTLTCNFGGGGSFLNSYSYFKNQEEKKNLEKNKALNVYALMMAVGKEFGIAWIWDREGGIPADEFCRKKELVGNFSCWGSAKRAVAELKRQFAFLDIVELNSVTMSDANATLHYQVYINYASRDTSTGIWEHAFTQRVNKWDINKNSGMIGLPTWTGGGRGRINVTFRTLLNASYRKYDMVTLKSDISKSLNGKYLINTVQHIGHLRGNEWYSDVDCYKIADS